LPRRRRKTLKKEMRTQIKGVMLLALAAVAFIGLISPDQAGGIGQLLSSFMRSLAGDAALVIPFFVALLALRTFLPQNKLQLKNRLSGLLLVLLIYMTWVHLQLLINRFPGATGFSFFYDSLLIGYGREGGGLLGALTATALYILLGPVGGKILLASISVIAVLIIFDISIKRITLGLFRVFESIVLILKKVSMMLAGLLKVILNAVALAVEKVAQKRSMAAVKVKEPEETAQKDEPDVEEKVDDTAVITTGDYAEERSQIAIEPELAAEPPKEETPAVTVSRKGSTAREYIFPPLNLLTMPVSGEEQQTKNSKDRAKLLENTLLSFGVRAKVVHVQSGPTVTRFEVQPEAGVKVSKIISLSDDLALNLAAPLVRIEAPIPGKAALGIEVPNKVISLVNLREVMSDRTFKMSVSPLTAALGKDITGIAVIADLTKMPHLLIAGATGAGKSVCLNTIITSILYKAGPEQVRFMMIDPKVVELSIYNGIPHLLMPVVTDPRKASLALRNMVREMGRRYDLFAKLGVRDIGTYNELTNEDSELEKLSYIVVIIDELADLMMVSPGEVEDSIARLAQMSRAAGIHLIVATQRPSVDVLTGIIKANITSRVAFTVSSQFDSRTILDMAGAEKLLGRGDMLFYPVGAVKPFRVQGAYISEVEVKKITDFIKEQGNVDYLESGTFLEAPEEADGEEADALFAEAIDLVVRTGQASISLLQRRFRIGYTRAARLIDDLERRGVVGPFEGSKPREVLVTQEQADQICEEFNNRRE
jgi:DNA segregation ATPase FtsK/SpoIIIE, S-DNA-T family